VQQKLQDAGFELDAVNGDWTPAPLAGTSGGLRIDLGLARHVHCLSLSDPDYTEHHLQALCGASLLLPPVSILHWSWSQWRGDYPPSKLDFASLPIEEFDSSRSEIGM
jgi:alpha-galactosidase